jgi:serine/threonine protein kinase
LDKILLPPSEIGISLPLATGDMAKAIKRRRGGVPIEKRERWVYELLSGIHFMHKNGYFHGDIKPENVLIISDRAVLSDLGLTGLNILNSETCQSICNPQLLYLRKSDSSGMNRELIKTMTHPIYKKPFKNSQTDLWALGETIYFVENGVYPINNNVNEMNHYIQTNVLRIKGRFDTIVKTLMNPDPEQLDINLTILLGEEPFNEKYTDYISGTINTDIQNENPVIFNEKVKTVFGGVFRWFFKIAEKIGNLLAIPDRTVNKIVTYNTIDLFYRVFHTIKHVLEKDKIPENEFSNLILTCFLISSKIYNSGIPVLDLVFLGVGNRIKMLETERNIVEILGGVLDRDLPLFYGISYDKFKKWIIENPDKYEQYNMAGLVTQINEIEL